MALEGIKVDSWLQLWVLWSCDIWVWSTYSRWLSAVSARLTKRDTGFQVKMSATDREYLNDFLGSVLNFKYRSQFIVYFQKICFHYIIIFYKNRITQNSVDQFQDNFSPTNIVKCDMYSIPRLTYIFSNRGSGTARFCLHLPKNKEECVKTTSN